mmetsp:Transcript_16957/g.55474  ORF Transcript_16957/g.55474 Transcript_16957/m.55474 type:complete len:270 (+) Transcript_16957:1652-2461(+)
MLRSERDCLSVLDTRLCVVPRFEGFVARRLFEFGALGVGGRRRRRGRVERLAPRLRHLAHRRRVVVLPAHEPLRRELAREHARDVLLRRERGCALNLAEVCVPDVRGRGPAPEPHRELRHVRVHHSAEQRSLGVREREPVRALVRLNRPHPLPKAQVHARAAPHLHKLRQNAPLDRHLNLLAPFHKHLHERARPRELVLAALAVAEVHHAPLPQPSAAQHPFRVLLVLDHGFGLRLLLLLALPELLRLLESLALASRLGLRLRERRISV